MSSNNTTVSTQVRASLPRDDESIPRPAPFSLTVDHPLLTETDAAAIRTFLRKYDQYVHEVSSRARQISGSTSSTEVVLPVDIKFCVDVDFLESSIDLGFISGANSYDEITASQVREFLDGRAKESKEVVTLDKLDKIVEAELHTNMKNTNATARMQDLFAQYHTILRRNGLKWIISENQKIAVCHVLSAIRPVSLKERLDSDLSFSHHNLKKDFKGFLSHAIDLAKAFQLVDCGPPSRRMRDSKRSGNANTNANDRQPVSGRRSSKDDNRKRDDKDRHEEKKLPVCLWEPHRQKGLRHLLKHCSECPDEEKKRILKAHAEEKALTGPSRSTRSQTGNIQKTTGRLAKEIDLSASPACSVTVVDGLSSLTGSGRCDDGSDESIASPNLANRAVLQGIGRLEVIAPVTIQVALSSSDKPKSFKFSRVWKVPRLVMELSSGRMALCNISFLVSDAELSSEDLLIGLPVLRHLGIDSRTLLERNRAQFDGTDCSSIPLPTQSHSCGTLGRLMMARLQRVHGKEPLTDNKYLDPSRPRSNYYVNKFDEDPFPDPNLMDVDESTKADSDPEDIDSMIQRAKDNGLPKQYWSTFETLVHDFSSTFKTSFSSTPSKVEPLRITLTPDAKPVRVKLRNYSQSQREFMRKMMAELMSYGIVYPNPTSAWACAPLIVPKPGPAQWRFTADLKPVNRFTVPFQFPMPIVEHELTKTKNSKFFANVDFTHSYWQLRLHKDSQECQSIITPDGIYSSTRVLHGTTNAVLYLQSFLSTHMPQDLRDRILLWVDDCLFHSETVDGLLRDLRTFFSFCAEWNWLLNPLKCTLFALQAKWCGRIVSEMGIRHDPKNLDALLEMDCPSTGGQLQQFLCAMQWLRSAIPQFQTLVKELHEFLERVYAHVGKRTKRAVARASLDRLGWTEKQTTAFEACKKAIADRVTLAHRDESKRLCIYTDASDSYWSGMVTQVPRDQVTRSHEDQDHDPLAFHSGRFSTTQMGWSTLEKEAFAVMASIERSHWLASCLDGFDLFTDHNNLIFIFDPLAVMPDINQAATRKVLRWSVRLSTYKYICCHISGDDNVWADLLTRWSIPLTIRRLVRIPPLPTTFKDFEWPSSASLRSTQDQHASSRPESAILIDNLWRIRGPALANPLWVPDEASDLQLRLCIISHTGAAGHRAVQATTDALAKEFYWSTLATDVQLFVSSCIHCLSTTGGKKIPRPFGPSLHGTKPNDLVQFDYLELGLSRSGDKYVLMVRDDHSSYCWLYPATTTNASTAADALLDWSAAFGAPLGLMSDGPTHFKNETVRLLTEGLRTSHHFTQPYCPWSNGAVERLGKEVLRVARAVLSELQMRQDDWPQLLPLFQSALNNAPSPQRNNVAPITAFTGRPPSTPISTFIRSDDGKPVTLSDAQEESVFNIQQLITSMDELHPKVYSHSKIHRERMRDIRSKGELPNFSEGDYVLVARDDFFEGEKLCLRWRGPRRIITPLSDYVFKVEDLRNGNQEDIHGTRLKLYSDSSLDEKAILSHVLSSETGMPVSRLLRLIESNNQLFVVVRWKGLSAKDDTKEPILRVYEDVPKLLLKLLARKSTSLDLQTKAHAAIGL